MNLTPTQKADELIEKFYQYMPFNDKKIFSTGEHPAVVKQMELISATQCAIEHLDLLIEATKKRTYRWKANVIEWYFIYNKELLEVKQILTDRL